MLKKLFVKLGLIEDPKKAIERFIAEINLTEKADIPFVKKPAKKKKAPAKKAAAKKKTAKKAK